LRRRGEEEDVVEGQAHHGDLGRIVATGAHGASRLAHLPSSWGRLGAGFEDSASGAGGPNRRPREAVVTGTMEPVNDPLRHGMPPDPFAGDPDDPAAELAGLDPVDDDLPSGPLDADERLASEEDLADLTEFRRLLAPLGVKGVAVQCEDCAEEHYHEWDML